MNPERWRRIQELFEAVYRLDPDLRRAELERRCGGDDELLREVEALLGHDEPTSSGAGDGPATAPYAPMEPPRGLPAGGRIGPYEIVDRLGRGGSGIVYLAERVEPYRQRVALKILSVADDRTRARFESERQHLADLEHPNIVRLLDGGVADDGRPYFVMELVEGAAHLDDACDRRGLSVRGRVECLRTVARAVAYAHGRGTLHRDLKPANVLVTPDGVPKVADFGLAGSIGSDPGLTGQGQVMGTPSYMSPEQVRGADAARDPRIDVYGFGATMYTVLAGRPPFRAETPVATCHLVASEEPVPLRRLLPGLPADVETICLRCLEKEPARRYPSMAEVADDLGRFLEDRPIVARPVGRAERAWRWCRRNRALAAALAAVAAATAVGVAGVAWQWSIAVRERTVAERSLNRAISGLDGFTAFLKRPELQRREIDEARRAALVGIRDQLVTLEREIGDNPRVAPTLVLASTRVAEIAGDFGDAAAARTAIREAIARGEAELAREPGSIEVRESLLKALHWALILGDDGWEQDQARAAAIVDDLARLRPESAGSYLRLQCRNDYNVGIRMLDSRRDAAAEALFRRAVEAGEGLLKESGEGDDLARTVASAYACLAELESNAGRAEASAASLRRALDLFRSEFDRAPDDFDAIAGLVQVVSRWQDHLARSGDLEGAVRTAEENAETVRRAIERPGWKDHERIALQRDLARREYSAQRAFADSYAANEASPERQSAALAGIEAACRRVDEVAGPLRRLGLNDRDVDYYHCMACVNLHLLTKDRGSPRQEWAAWIERARSLIPDPLPDDPSLREEFENVRRIAEEAAASP